MDDEELPVVEALSTPTIEMTDEEVEAAEFTYSHRAPGDWVISGPVTELQGHGPGPRFKTVRAAWEWAQEKYGDRLKGRIREAEEFGGRYAFLIRGANGD